MTRFAAGSLVRLVAPLGDAWSALRLDAALVLDQPARPYSGTHPEIIVAPISYAVEHASEFDVRLPLHTLGVPAMVEIWNQRTILVSELEVPAVATLDDDLLGVVYEVHNAMFGIADMSDCARSHVGTPIEQATDPRIEYQKKRAEQSDDLSRRLHGAVMVSPSRGESVGSYLLVSTHSWHSDIWRFTSADSRGTRWTQMYDTEGFHIFWDSQCLAGREAFTVAYQSTQGGAPYRTRIWEDAVSLDDNIGVEHLCAQEAA